MKKSKGEETLAFQLTLHKIPFQREVQFAKPRRWRADFILPRHIMVEVEGGTWGISRHTTGVGYEKDLEKYNQASINGYTVLRYTTGQVMNGTAINQIIEVMKDKNQ